MNNRFNIGDRVRVLSTMNMIIFKKDGKEFVISQTVILNTGKQFCFGE